MTDDDQLSADLASLRTRAVKVDGGWRLTGQKVWTSVAERADWGICLARTDPDVGYALSPTAIAERISAGFGQIAAVDTGACVR